ncbi:MAG: aldo/keto reductase [Phycisphaerae bacterium]|nr:aldo/keto reductase [Phycisphaerae bacterium]
MKAHGMNRRQFLQTSAALAGSAVLSPLARTGAAGEAVKRTAVDQVALGKTGLRLSRLGFGTGSNSGRDQAVLGKEGFIKLIHYAYDKGITYIDAAQSYQTFGWIGEAIRGLPREKLFLQSKVPGRADDILATIDRHRTTFGTDYIDSLLIHCMVRPGWIDEMKRAMDGFSEAKDKKWIRAKGVSCHTLPALKAAVTSGWPEVHLVRVNPQGKYMDGEDIRWDGQSATEVPPVMEQIKLMHDKGRGVIGMKLIGNGDFKDPADREKAARFAMACKDIDAVVIGFASEQQVDEAIDRINRALAAAEA